ncbi:hypothetical protein HYX04_04280 [Candidatus Woesearchaeota archaeon]|nr:hypothetical protein [Candidatus Woesearchaeota archaeon]
MDAKAKFELLKRFYADVENKHSLNGRYSKKTRIGFFHSGLFAASNIDGINVGIEQLLADGLVNQSGWFLDAGCGDGRVTALTAGVHRIPSIGIEYDREVFDFGGAVIKMLKEYSMINGTPLVFTRGDFTKDRTYRRAGVMFEDIATVFNYIDNHEDIAAKIAKQSPRGTIFILEDFPWIPITSGIREFEGLTYVRTIPPDSNSKLRRCLHVYRK